jgi:hypothetical protein
MGLANVSHRRHDEARAVTARSQANLLKVPRRLAALIVTRRSLYGRHLLLSIDCGVLEQATALRSDLRALRHGHINGELAGAISANGRAGLAMHVAKRQVFWRRITSRALIFFVNDPALSLDTDQYWKGSMIRFTGLLCLLLSVLSGPALAGSCVVPYIRTIDNQTANGTMYVVSGKRCSIVLLRSAGPMHSAKLVSRPSNGSVSIDGGRVVYVSSAGYVGDDHFTYARQGLNALNQPVTRTINVNVKVSARL